MKILIVHMRYTPDATGTAPLVTQLAEGLVSAGEQVTVVASVPHYGRSSVPTDHRGSWLHRTEENGVQVIRTGAFPRWSGSVIGRSIDYALYSCLAMLTSLRTERPDVVLAVAPPITVGVVGWLVRVVRGVPMVYVAQDIWPDGLVEMGILRMRPLIWLFRRLEDWVYRAADAVVVVSDEMKTNLLRKGVPDRKVAVIENWVDLEEVRPEPKDNAFRQEHGNGAEFVVLFAGNLGFSAALETILRAANALSGHDIMFLIVGQGSARSLAVDLKDEWGLDNVRLLPTQPVERFNQMMAAADVSLVTLKQGMGALSVPSKTYSIMASGRPVLAAVPRDSAIRRLVQESGAGCVVPAEDPAELARAILAMKSDAAGLLEMGQRGRRFAEDNFGKLRALDGYRRAIQTVLEGAR